MNNMGLISNAYIVKSLTACHRATSNFCKFIVTIVDLHRGRIPKRLTVVVIGNHFYVEQA